MKYMLHFTTDQACTKSILYELLINQSNAEYHTNKIGGQYFICIIFTKIKEVPTTAKINMMSSFELKRKLLKTDLTTINDSKKKKM